MSSYWAGYSGNGLVLTEDEFLGMMDRYKACNPHQARSVAEAMDEGLNGRCLVKSAYAGTVADELYDPDVSESSHDVLRGKLFDVCELTEECVEGARFWPFYRSDGRMNVSMPDGAGRAEDLEYRLLPVDGGNSLYVFFADREMDGPRAFEEKPYASYRDFVREFMDKLAKYLPGDFDWNAHLGKLSYACYA